MWAIGLNIGRMGSLTQETSGWLTRLPPGLQLLPDFWSLKTHPSAQSLPTHNPPHSQSFLTLPAVSKGSGTAHTSQKNWCVTRFPAELPQYVDPKPQYMSLVPHNSAPALLLDSPPTRKSSSISVLWFSPHQQTSSEGSAWKLEFPTLWTLTQDSLFHLTPPPHHHSCSQPFSTTLVDS